MAGFNGLVLAVFLISAMALGCHGAAEKRAFSTLENSLQVTSTVKDDAVLKAGVDSFEVTLSTNPNANLTASYKTVTVKLCYAPPSQVDRPWRKTVLDNIAKDKTCQFTVGSKDYGPTSSNVTVGPYTVKKDVPGAIYFIRAYVYDATGKEIAYGQTADAEKKAHFFTIVGITGRTASIDIASGVFSAFSVLSLVYFFFVEKKKARRAT